jgi:uncharacterized lipoprotein YajG
MAGTGKLIHTVREDKDMKHLKQACVMAVGLVLLGACHTDPFSIKPEVNVTLPEKTPATQPAPEPEAVEPDAEPGA